MRHFQVAILFQVFINKPTAGPFPVLSSIILSTDECQLSLLALMEYLYQSGLCKNSSSICIKAHRAVQDGGSRMHTNKRMVKWKTEDKQTSQISWSLHSPHLHSSIYSALTSLHLSPCQVYNRQLKRDGTLSWAQKTSIRKRSASGSTQWLQNKKDKAREIYCQAGYDICSSDLNKKTEPAVYVLQSNDII